MGTVPVEKHLHPLFLLLGNVLLLMMSCARSAEYVSAVGDPGMRRDGLRVGFEAWNFCNEVGEEASGMGSPRAADCFDLVSSKHRDAPSQKGKKKGERVKQ